MRDRKSHHHGNEVGGARQTRSLPSVGTQIRRQVAKTDGASVQDQLSGETDAQCRFVFATH